MRIIDENGVEIFDPDLEKGYLKEDRIFVAHHETVEAVEEQWHYETIAEYPNGGKDVEKVVDVPGVEAQEAWDEYEEIYRYVLFVPQKITTPRNIVTGEYITINGVMYKTTANIPNGCEVIEGQNAIVTTVEEQLYELTKGE